MFKITQLFLLKPFFVIEILIALFLFSFKLKKRSYPTLRYISAIIICLGLSIVYPIFDDVSYSWWYSSLMFLILFLVCVAAMFFIYDLPWQRIFFISITAYTIQHFSYEVYTLISILLNLNTSASLGMYGGDSINLGTDLLPFLFCFVTYLVIYSIFFFLMEKKIEAININVNNNSILFISALILLTDIIFNSVIIYIEKDYNMLYSIIVCGYNLLCCCMIFYIQIKMVLTEKMKSELETTSQLLHQAEEQFKETKENIDLINLKCHDLKHQIREYGSKKRISQDTIEDLEGIINIYDSTIKTNNEVLDLILTEKSLYCQKKNIKFSCLADCSKLSFISESDLYSLFGNIIDNAVEATSKIQNQEKRNINLIVRNVKKYVSISVENFFENEITLDKNGIPMTTKSNKNFHGFGLKSIKMIVNKYQGDLTISTDNEIFSIYILFKI